MVCDMVLVLCLSWCFVPDELSTTVVAPPGTGTAPAGYQPGIGTVDAVPAEGHIQGVRIAVLGPLEVDEGRILLAPRDQVALEALAARPGETVRAEAIAEALWGEHLPPSWPKVVQGCVSRLRKVLGSAAIATSGAGYRLVLHRDDFDHLCFEDLLVRAGGLLAVGEPERARYASGQALSLWRGDPLERLTEWESGRIEAERLGERRRDAEDLYAESSIRAGRHGDVLGELHRLVAQQPTRERRWGLLALAQYQDGRQAEALATLQRARAALVNDFGLDPGPQLAELEEAILRQDPALLAEGALPVAAASCPYLGLVAYDIGDAPAYFGREADVVACLQRLDETGVLAVVGPSGCGKSSLIRAGVAAALVRDGHPVKIVTPGPHPEEVLTLAPSGAGAVFVIDQCEEALGLPEISPQREAFFAGLVQLAARGRLVLSLRADRLGELAVHPEFAHLAEKGLYLLGGMGPAELRRAIEGPAAQAGLRLEPGLVDLLVREVEGSPGALPLLSHVLRQTWRRREGDTLTVEGYAATGGVREAVAQSAERLYRELSAAQQGMLRDLMVRLVSSDDAGEPVRTRVARRSVTPDDEHTAVVEALVGARLLSSDGDTVEIAHESLAVAWPRLRSWLDDDVDGLRIMRHLTVAAESWDELGRPDSELYRGVRQARAAEWRHGHEAELTPAERSFLDASAELGEAEQRATEEQVRRERRSNQRLRAGLAAVAVLLAVSIVAASLAKTAADSADRQAFRAEQQSRVADARRLGAEALRSREIDRALLLGIAGARLHPSADTVNNLTGVLDRVPQLVGAARRTAQSSVSVSPDGAHVAIGEVIHGVTILDAVTLQETARNHDIPVAGVRYNPAGSTLAVAVNPWTPTSVARVDPVPLRLLDAATARLLPDQPGGTPKGRVLHHSFGFSPDGRWLAAGFISPMGSPPDSVVLVWDTTALARPTYSFTVPYIVAALQIGRGANRIYATSFNGDLHLLDPSAARELRSIHTAKASTIPFGPVAVTPTPDGKQLAVRDGGQVRLLDAESLTTVASFREEGTIGLPITVAPDGRSLAYMVDGTPVVRSLTDPARPGTRYPSGDAFEPWGLAFGKDGGSLYAARDDGLLLAWDSNGSRRFLPSTPPASGRLAAVYAAARVSPDGRTVAYLTTSAVDGTVFLQFLDVRTHTLGPAIRTGDRFDYWIGLAWRPNSAAVATTLGTERLRLWDRASGALVEEHHEPGDRITSADFSRDGSRLVIGTRNGWVKSVAGSGRRVGPPARVSSSGPVTTVAVDARGDRAVASTDDGLTVLDLTGGTVTRRADLGYTANAAVWTLDGKTIALSGADFRQGGVGVVSTLDATTLARRTSTSGRTVAGGGELRLEPNGRRFLTAAGDRVALWDATTGFLLRAVGVDARTSGGFDRDGSSIVLAAPTATVYRWDPDPDAAIEAACRIAGRDMTEQEWHDYLPERPFESVCPA
jgi:DNA-binding SARP family transcriptional activator/WD40 repeat protein